MTSTVNIDRGQLLFWAMQLPKSEQKILTREIMSSWDEVDALPEPPRMTMEEINARISAAERDMLNGKGVTSEEFHERLESKYPWLRD